jgi:polyisoprenoid-binding protein YceI
LHIDMNQTAIVLALLTAAAGAAHAQSATYAIDPTHTFVTFEAKHFNTSTLRGRFDKKEGAVVFDRKAKTGKAEITIDAGSVSTGVGPLDGHLKSKDFFNAGASPTVKFVGDQFTFDGDKVSAVGGQLTMLGKTMPVTLKASNFNCYQNPMLKREVCGGDFETTIARSQWGMNYGLDYGIPDNIRLLVQIEAVKQ